MKKKLVNMVVSAAVVTAMMFSVTACGSKAQDTGADVQSEVQTSEAADETSTVANETTAVADEAANDDASDLPTLEEWINSEDAVSAVNLLNQELEGSGMQMAFKADGDTFTISCQFSEEVSFEDEGALEEYFDQSSGMFASMGEDLRNRTSNSNVIVRVEYINADGSELYSKEF